MDPQSRPNQFTDFNLGLLIQGTKAKELFCKSTNHPHIIHLSIHPSIHHHLPNLYPSIYPCIIYSPICPITQQDRHSFGELEAWLKQ
jgi:hypothetical protein